ncbi:two pore domain potassium channel family protein [Halobacillus fulvus]|nr:two pore domain potassium channel family protein [Halobacillus fulvus]
MENKKISLAYELTLASLVIFSLVVDLPSKQGLVLDSFIWTIFVIDYIVRLFKAKEKWQFVKSHPLDLIAIIPLDQIFRTVRLVRLVRVIRLISLLRRRRSFFDILFEKYRVDKFFVFIIALMFIASLSMKWVEPGFETYGDSLWWAIVTTTTVGYGDLYPETVPGRIIASVLMITGIGMIGVVTGSVANFFSTARIVPAKSDPSPHHEHLDKVKSQLERGYDQLRAEDVEDMIRHLNEYKKEHF